MYHKKYKELEALAVYKKSNGEIIAVIDVPANFFSDNIILNKKFDIRRIYIGEKAFIGDDKRIFINNSNIIKFKEYLEQYKYDEE